MKYARIDHETVGRILDAADIVDVVSDFVTLKRRGANYIGLCPFHNERTPSFSVSKSKGICKCFSCGKGGSPVNFIMEIEQVSYSEALRYLAKKYGIEIKEREMTSEEREAETTRESMLAVNDFAMKHFEHNMRDTEAGRNIGLAYFRERGINDAMIDRFHLGYALEERYDLVDTAAKAGYSQKYLVETGLCTKNDQGRLSDRFRGRVIYPVFTLSGKVVAFGGRTLRSDKSIAKYINSPESIIYSKRSELYGLYQAKQAINKKDKCILVEGYMDVISMHQSGVENVVASSGTSLTDRQVNLIHRFTDNVTVIYDSDPAGIKASLRGIDMLLAEGLNVKTLLLPEGDDPDSFAQSHSSSEVEQYIAENETDFIRFKTKILLEGAENDPIARSNAITEIVRSIAVIPGEIQRTVYIQECSRMLSIDESVLHAQMVKFMADNARRKREEQIRENGRRQLDSDPSTAEGAEQSEKLQPQAQHEPKHASPGSTESYLRPFESQLLMYVLKYGMAILCDAVDENGNNVPMTLLDYVRSQFEIENIGFSNPDIATTYSIVCQLAADNFDSALLKHNSDRLAAIDTRRAEGRAQISEKATDMESIRRLENELEAAIAAESAEADDLFRCSFLAHHLVNHPEDAVRKLTTELVAERYVLSKIHTRYTKIETERERLTELVPRALNALKDAIVDCRLREVKERMKALSNDESTAGEMKSLMEQLIELSRLKTELARYLGDRIIGPR